MMRLDKEGRRWAVAGSCLIILGGGLIIFQAQPFGVSAPWSIVTGIVFVIVGVLPMLLIRKKE